MTGKNAEWDIQTLTNASIQLDSAHQSNDGLTPAPLEKKLNVVSEISWLLQIE